MASMPSDNLSDQPTPLVTKGEGEPRWIQLGILGTVCAVVIGVYLYTSHEGAFTQPSLSTAGNYYNLLVEGFRAGQLSLKKEVPPLLTQIADPYTWSPQRPLGLMDLSYYRGKLYLYFGVTPALLLFWPYRALTGQYLSFRDVVTVFCVVGFLSSAGLLYGLWRRFFVEVRISVVAVGVLALGLATFIPPLLARCDVYEVAISCGYAMRMLALWAIWKSLRGETEQRRDWWLAVASLAYGLAIGARPNLLFGAAILFVPVVQAWHERRSVRLSLVAATVPIMMVGVGLMLYNLRRFDNPFEFGNRYLLTTRSYLHEHLFSLRYFWLNLRVYFFEPAIWTGRFPFVHRVTSLAAGDAFGVMTNLPLTWLALVTPLGWRGRGVSAPTTSDLRWVVIAIALLFVMCALPVGLYSFVAIRYQVDFLPQLMLLAVIGVLSLEQAMVYQPRWRGVARWTWIVLLAFSIMFGLLVCVQRWAEADNDLGMQRQQAGQLQEAIQYYKRAVRLYPDLADGHANLGNTMVQLGRVREAVGQYEQALRIEPDFSKAHNDLAIALARLGRLPEAIDHWKQVLRIEPDSAEAHNNLGIALRAAGRIPEAIDQWEQALQIHPDSAEPHNNLGIALRQIDRLPEAIDHWVQALRINPGLAEAHFNLGVALKDSGRLQEAIGHLEEAVRLKPNDSEAQQELERAHAAR
jgi:Flp pilus assembly protein TadD